MLSSVVPVPTMPPVPGAALAVVAEAAQGLDMPGVAISLAVE